MMKDKQAPLFSEILERSPDVPSTPQWARELRWLDWFLFPERRRDAVGSLIPRICVGALGGSIFSYLAVWLPLFAGVLTIALLLLFCSIAHLMYERHPIKGVLIACWCLSGLGVAIALPHCLVLLGL